MKDENCGPIIPRPLYAVTIHQIIAEGNLAKMKALAAEVEDLVAAVHKLEGPHKELKAAIQKSGGR
jgi:outer membrane murein-binding lipoprotein Lpp